MSGLPRFARDFGGTGARLSRIGEGELGGKAEGLIRAERVLARCGSELDRIGFRSDVPRLVVLATGFFDQFVDRNGLAELPANGASDAAIADAFHRAPIPPELVGDLRALAENVRVPLAVRSSSALEDAVGEPFAGVYGTKMVPGDQPDAAARFRSLLDAVKFVWASACFARARAYLAATRHRGERERMAVVVQAVVGGRHGERFYPEISAVARSFDFYPTGDALPEDGVLVLALGLGKTIVDGELCWSVSLGRPRAGPPFASARELVENTQRRFWAVRIGAPPPYDPMAETEFLVRAELAQAEADGALRHVASTFDPASERILPGTGRRGARVLDFAPLLVQEELPLVPAVRALLAACETELGAPVEIELALAVPPGSPPRLGLLQVR
ncbi:MAG TPA: PEP/pyruvate-binding domain-containing protein, partial [Thermoanaerobaculia bacterium]|nr:PEP/pyruvate-binding domain-containing protein [Thermoanaerobaculia bacterium]